MGLYVIGAGRHAVAPRLRARQRVLRPRHRAAELPLARAFQAARLLGGPELRIGALPETWPAQPRRPRRQGGLDQALPDRRGEHEPHDREPRVPPLQVPAVPPARRRAPALLRHRDPELRRRHPAPSPAIRFEIEGKAFGAPLRNALAMQVAKSNLAKVASPSSNPPGPDPAVSLPNKGAGRWQRLGGRSRRRGATRPAQGRPRSCSASRTALSSRSSVRRRLAEPRRAGETDRLQRWPTATACPGLSAASSAGAGDYLDNAGTGHATRREPDRLDELDGTPNPHAPGLPPARGQRRWAGRNANSMASG